MSSTDEKQFTKTDMERMGIFKEMGYISIGDKFTGTEFTFNDAASKDKQLLPGGSKSKNATQAGYFAEKFDRVFETEAYTDPIKLRRQYRVKESKKNLGKPFLPSNGDKKMNGFGTHFGTIGGNVSAFSPTVKEGKEYKAPGKNLYTSPGKKGTGYGYTGITLAKYDNYSSEQYDQIRHILKKENELHKKLLKGGAFRLNMHPRSMFDDNPYRSDRPLPAIKDREKPKLEIKPFKPSSPPKNPGGMKAGTFDPYPSHSDDPYKVQFNRVINVVNKTGKVFIPNPGPKSAPVNSILDQNIMKKMNRENFRAVTSVFTY